MTFLQEHLKKNPGLELLPVQVAGEDRGKANVASHEDVAAFINTLDHEATIRFDVTQEEVEEALIHALPVSEDETVDIDMDQEPVIPARRRRHHFVYFAGFLKHRPLWTTDSRCARVFDSGDAVVIEAFQFNEDGSVLKEVFQELGLQLLPAPKLPESI